MSETGAVLSHSESVRRALTVLQKDFTAVNGTPFKYYFCPMLHADEETKLSMGHVVNQAIPHSCRKWAVQRTDVDGFFGTIVERDFIMATRLGKIGVRNAAFDPSLSKEIKPKIMLNGKECHHHHFDGTVAPGHTGVILDGGDGAERRIVLHMSPQEMITALDAKWQMVVEGDHRISYIATMIKAAFLTMFRLFGYRYALSLAGRAVGFDILGRFYRENHAKTKAEVKKAARQFFREFATMVRPIEGVSGTPPRGTIEDRRVQACFGSNGEAYALVVCVRTGTDLHAVFLPAFTRADSVAAYYEFLRNDRETIWLADCQYDTEKEHWIGVGGPTEQKWPKLSDTFDFSDE